MIIMIFGYAFHTMIGGVVNAFGGPNEPQALIYGTAVLPITLGMGVTGFLVLFLRERFLQSNKELINVD
jgi:hypothetical protein